MNKKVLRLTMAAMLLTMLSGEALAHPESMELSGFWAGFRHPWLGLDHLLVLSGLGLWLAGQNSVFQRVAVTAFLAAMATGAILAMQGIRFGYVETVVVASVLLTGLLLLTAVRRLPSGLGISLLLFIAVMHGQAHGGEMPLGTAAWAYVSGFVAATLALQSLGLACGRLLQRLHGESVSRLIGGVTGLVGVWLLLNG